MARNYETNPLTCPYCAKPIEPHYEPETGRMESYSTHLKCSHECPPDTAAAFVVQAHNGEWKPAPGRGYRTVARARDEVRHLADTNRRWFGWAIVTPDATIVEWTVGALDETRPDGTPRYPNHAETCPQPAGPAPIPTAAS